MMGETNPQPAFFYNISLETFVAGDHPLRAIRPLIDDRAIRRACRELYSPIGRPSIPPEQLFLALVGGYLLGVTSDRKLVMELQCNMALRWFVGLNLDQQPWDASTFSQNRRRRFDASGLLERLFDETVKRGNGRGAGESARQRRRDLGPSQRQLQELRADRSGPGAGRIQAPAAGPGSRRRRRPPGPGQSRRGLSRREAQQRDPSLADRSGLPLRVQGHLGYGGVSRLYGERPDGEPPPPFAGAAAGDLPVGGRRDRWQRHLAASGPAPVGLQADHAGGR